MANLTDGTNLTGSVTLTKSSGTKITLDTDKKYITKDIELTINAQTATPTFTGGGVSGSASASATNATISDSTNNSGVSITAAGSATRAKVTYNGAVDGWVTKASGADALAAGSATALTSKTYYINGATLVAPASNSRTFAVTAPTGENSHTYTFSTNSNSRTTIQIDSVLTIEKNDADESIDFVYS